MSQKIKINIAGRFYPLTINADDEEAVRKAGKDINNLLAEFEEKYAVNDKQDAIAMVALQVASKYYLQKNLSEGNSKDVNLKVTELTEFIERELENYK